MMHILILPSWYGLTKNDTHGSFFKEQAEALVRAQNKVGVIFPEDISLKKINIFFKKKKGMTINEENGVYTYRYRCVNWLPKTGFSSVFNWKYFGLKLFESYILEHGKPDIVHVHSLLYGGVLAKEIFDKYGIPYVITEHYSGYLKPKLTVFKKKNIVNILKSASGLFTVSNFFSEKMKENFGYEWGVIPNLVTEVFFESMQKGNNNCYNFICIGSLLKNKNQMMVVKSFEMEFKNKENIILNIIGDGPEYLKIKDYIEINNINNIILSGQCSRESVRNFLKNSDCLVSASNYETFSVVLIEALAQGIPVISTDCGGPQDIVNNRNGYLVEVGNTIEMASVLNKCIANEFKSQEIKKDCYERFGEKVVTDKIMSIYKGIVFDVK